MQMKSTEMSLYNPNLNMFVSHPKVDVLYNPNLDDSFYVIQTVGCSSNIMHGKKFASQQTSECWTPKY